MVIKSSAQREIRFVSEDQIVRLYEGRQYLSSTRLMPKPIPDYMVQLLVAISEHSLGLKNPVNKKLFIPDFPYEISKKMVNQSDLPGKLAQIREELRLRAPSVDNERIEFITPPEELERLRREILGSAYRTPGQELQPAAAYNN